MNALLFAGITFPDKRFPDGKMYFGKWEKYSKTAGSNPISLTHQSTRIPVHQQWNRIISTNSWHDRVGREWNEMPSVPRDHPRVYMCITFIVDL